LGSFVYWAFASLHPVLRALGFAPLISIPALAACTAKRMKTVRFSHFADFAARKRFGVLVKICFLEKVPAGLFRHF